MFYTPEEVTDVSYILHITQTTVQKKGARKSLYLFTNIFDVKKRTAIHRVESAKSKRRYIKVVNSLCTKIQNEKGIQKSMIILNIIFIHR